jgi:hypothetical protein
MKKLLMILLLAFSVTASGEYYANSNIDLTYITQEQAYELFTFQSKFVNAEKITIVLPPYGTRSFKLLAFDLGKTSSSYYDIIQSKVHGGVVSPEWADSELSVLRRVSAIPYSIGFFYDKIAINTGASVRIISVR